MRSDLNELFNVCSHWSSKVTFNVHGESGGATYEQFYEQTSSMFVLREGEVEGYNIYSNNKTLITLPIRSYLHTIFSV